MAAVVALVVMLPACGNEPSYAEDVEAAEDAAAEPYSDGGFAGADEGAALEMAADDLSDQTFQDVGDISLCTQDCSGHDAGFEWARENDITDPYECGGKSHSFIEGCEAYAESVQEHADEYEMEGEY